MSGEMIKLIVAASVGAVVAWRLTARRRTVPRRPMVRRNYKGQRTVTDIAGRLERERVRTTAPRPITGVLMPPTIRTFDGPAKPGSPGLTGIVNGFPAPEEICVQTIVHSDLGPYDDNPTAGNDRAYPDEPLSYSHLAGAAHRLGYQWDCEHHEKLTGLLARGRLDDKQPSSDHTANARPVDRFDGTKPAKRSRKQAA